MKDKFNEYIEQNELKLNKYSHTFNTIGNIKLLLALFLIISIYLTFKRDYESIFVSANVTCLAALISLWFYQSKIREKINYSKGQIAINKANLDRISGTWDTFDDIGEEFVDFEHGYACDLDIVGKKSVFQFLNRTNTWHGRQSLADDLLNSNYSNEEIIERQEAIKELSNDIEFANHIEYYFSKIGIDSIAEKLAHELKDESIFIENKIIKFLLSYVPPVTFIFIIATIILKLQHLYIFGAFFVVTQAIVWILGMPKNREYLGIITHLPYKLSCYIAVINIIKNKKFTSKKLLKIQLQLGTSELSAEKGLKELSQISDKMNINNNGILYILFNIFYLWDYQSSLMLEEWKLKYAHLSENWFITLGEFESLLSFSSLGNVNNNTCMPVVSTNNKEIEMQELGHPLIPNETRINNTLKLQDNIFIISGSNMSGKTTFLRTLGVNLVLAQCGSFVCGGYMTFSNLKIMTSMRIADNLHEGISTFYAELKRIKYIIELAKKDTNMIFLIDEIFRGTNSTDRLYGAKTVISKLDELGSVGIITTHDLELCELSNSNLRIKNYNFSEYYKEDKICFDYKIKSGKSTTTNAKHLMEMVGIV